MASHHSPSSSLADVDYDYDYYTYDHSPTSSLTNGSSSLPRPAQSSDLEPAVAIASSSSGPAHLRQKTSLANIDVPSFSKFRSQVSSIPVSSPSALNRKPLPFQHLPSRPTSLSFAERGSPRFAEPASRPFSLDSPIKQQASAVGSTRSPVSPVRSNSKRSSYAFPTHAHDRTTSIDSRVTGTNQSESNYGESRRSSIPVHARYAQEQTISHAPKLSVSSLDFASHYSPAQRLSNVSSMNGTREPPSMKLEIDGIQRTLTDESMESTDSPGTKRPKSPGGRFGNFFGWKGQKSGMESPTTTFSDQSPSSPGPSPNLQKPDTSPPNARLTPPGLDVNKGLFRPRSEYFDNADTPILIGPPETNAHVKQLEHELTEVSTELAESVKREMELEDEIERIKEGMTNGHSDTARRSSDYFSDSGTSSNRFPLGDADSRVDQMEIKLRRSEQEKAGIRSEMASRLQTELSRRRDLEQMVQKLEEQLQEKFEEESARGDLDDRVDELESTLEDTRRLLNQERQAKGSFEDLYTATREELERHKNEHDNLRDEVVPQLKARIEGLEQEAGDSQALVYENTRMQQELHAMKGRMHGRFGSIAEEDVGGAKGGLTRSASSRPGSRRGASLSRSASVLDRTEGGRQRSGSVGPAMSGDAVKEIEDQRDALHKALKLLIIRCDRQQREHERAIKKLTVEKKAAEISSPGRTVYHKEVSFLKEEVTTLRKRTEDALEQKWQYEKGLSGIKMDLDRAELETRGLRIILQEHDILGSSQRTQLADGQEGEEAANAKLQESISTAESERDQARKVAEEYRQRAQTVQDGSSTELMNSATRMDELADELEKQVQSNTKLRSRLAEAVAKGEQEQRESNGKIGEMQKRLATMEDSVLAAQQHSEATLSSHEAEARRLEEASTPALQRLTIMVPDKRRLTPTSPLMVKSPKLGSKKLSETSLLEMSRTQMLERKVRELEGLLREAEEDMQDVVQRVNKSQLEVAELQTERDAALNQMRKLQAKIGEEREKAAALMR